MSAAAREEQLAEIDAFAAFWAAEELRQAVETWKHAPHTEGGAAQLALLQEALAAARACRDAAHREAQIAARIHRERKAEDAERWVHPGQCGGCLVELPRGCPLCERSGLRTPSSWTRPRCYGCGVPVPTACAFCTRSGFGRPARLPFGPLLLTVAMGALAAYALWRR